MPAWLFWLVRLLGYATNARNRREAAYNSLEGDLVGVGGDTAIGNDTRWLLREYQNAIAKKYWPPRYCE